MNPRPLLAACLAAVLLYLSPAWCQELLPVGTRVQYDIIMSGAPERAMYRPGTIVKVENGWYHIQVDGEPGVRECPVGGREHWIVAGAPPAPAVAPAAPVAQPAPASPSPLPQGKGAPPDGAYTCQKISGSMLIGLGTFEIRGSTYRGIGTEGGFHRFNLDDEGNMSLTGGLRGLPDGWRLRGVRYVGLDYLKRPLIKIYYANERGTPDEIDAVRE